MTAMVAVGRRRGRRRDTGGSGAGMPWRVGGPAGAGPLPGGDPGAAGAAPGVRPVPRLGHGRRAAGGVGGAQGDEVGERGLGASARVRDPPQLLAGLRGGRALGGVVAQQAHEQGGQRAGLLRRDDLAGGHGVQERERVVVGAEGRDALDRGVQGGAEGEHVGRGGRVLAPGDLGGEVGRRAGEHPGAGQRQVAGGARDAEVGDLDGAVGPEQHVAGLDVAVHDPGLVGGVERVRHLAPDPRHRARLEGALLAEDGGEAARRQVLHDQPRLVALDRGVEHRDRVRVLQAGGDPALAQGALADLVGLPLVEAGVQEHLLDRDDPAQTLVRAAPHDAHRPRADAFLEAVAPGDHAGSAHRLLPVRVCTRVTVEVPTG